jgi:hypothetical protein
MLKKGAGEDLHAGARPRNLSSQEGAPASTTPTRPPSGARRAARMHRATADCGLRHAGRQLPPPGSTGAHESSHHKGPLLACTATRHPQPAADGRGCEEEDCGRGAATAQPARGSPPPASSRTCHGSGPPGPGQAQIRPERRRHQGRAAHPPGVAPLRRHAANHRNESPPPHLLATCATRATSPLREKGLRQGAHTAPSCHY